MSGGYRGVDDEGLPVLVEHIRNNRHDKRYKLYDPTKFEDRIETNEKWLEVARAWEDELGRLVSTYAHSNLSLAVALENGDVSTANLLLNEAWAGAPDSGYIHGIKGWDILCDLCSELPCPEEE